MPRETKSVFGKVGEFVKDAAVGYGWPTDYEQRLRQEARAKPAPTPTPDLPPSPEPQNAKGMLKNAMPRADDIENDEQRKK